MLPCARARGAQGVRAARLRGPRRISTRPRRVLRNDGVVRAADKDKGQPTGGDGPSSDGAGKEGSKSDPSKAAAAKFPQQSSDGKDAFDFGAKEDDEWGKAEADKATSLGPLAVLVLALSGALAYAAARLIAGHPTQQRLADTAKPEGVVMQRVESPQQARQAAEPQASRGPSEGDTDPVGYEAPMGEMEAIAEMPFWEMAPDEGQQLRDRQDPARVQSGRGTALDPKSLEATGALADRASERGGAAAAREERASSSAEGKVAEQRQTQGTGTKEASPTSRDTDGAEEAVQQGDKDGSSGAARRQGPKDAAAEVSTGAAASAVTTEEAKPADAPQQTRQQERTVARGDKAAAKADKANAAAQEAAANAKDAAETAEREQSAAQELVSERGDDAAAAARGGESAAMDAAWQSEADTSAERRSVPEINIERPAGAVDPATLASPPRDARERAQLAASAAAAAIQASEASSAHSAASCRAASEAAAAANAATHAVGVARGAAERHAEEELERALSRVHAARAQAADAEAAAAAHAAASNAMGSVVQEQREIAETLSQQPAPEAEATTTAEAVPIQERLSTFWQSRVAQPVAHAWAAVTAWLASVWAAFVNWTVSLGEYVKKTFFRKG